MIGDAAERQIEQQMAKYTAWRGLPRATRAWRAVRSSPRWLPDVLRCLWRERAHVWRGVLWGQLLSVHHGGNTPEHYRAKLEAGGDFDRFKELCETRRLYPYETTEKS